MSDQNEKREPGRPPKGESPVSLEVLERIAILDLEGRSQAAIAREIGVHRSEIDYLLREYIAPVRRIAQTGRVEKLFAQVEYLIQIAFEKFHESQQPEITEHVKKGLVKNGLDIAIVEKVITRRKSIGNIEWLKMVLACIIEQRKVLGAYTSQKHQLADEGLRVAGMTPSEVDAKMIERLMERIAERKRMDES